MFSRPDSTTFAARVWRVACWGSMVVLVVGLMFWRQQGADFWVTADRRGQELMKRGEFVEAAGTFKDPFRQAEALYRAGEFEKAASLFGGMPGAQAAYNQGNALVMLGKYEQAAQRYGAALDLQPDFVEAQRNLEIAQGRAERLKKEGGNMTGGEMGADDIVFDENNSSSDDQTETVEGEQQPMDESAMRALWLRQVQTTPAEFLKAKFAYQLSKQAGGIDE